MNATKTKKTRTTKAQRIAEMREFGREMDRLNAIPTAPIFELPAETRKLWNLIVAAK